MTERPGARGPAASGIMGAVFGRDIEIGSIAGRRRSALAVVGVALLAIGATSCGGDDEAGAEGPAASLSTEELTGGEGRDLAAEAAAPLDSGVIVDPQAPETTIPIVGSANELLPEIGVEISRLSAVIGTPEGTATMERIDGMWAAIHSEVETTRPDLVNGIEATVGLARSAVEQNRIEDADAAFDAITDLIDDWTGDS